MPRKINLAWTHHAVRNLYSSLLLGTLLICSGMFYGLALTSSNKRFQDDSSVLDGTWQLVEVTHVTADGKQTSLANRWRSLKIIVNRHYSTIVTDDNGRVMSSVAGLLEIQPGVALEYAGMLVKQQPPRRSEWQLTDGRLTQREQLAAGDSRIEVWQLLEQNNSALTD